MRISHKLIFVTAATLFLVSACASNPNVSSSNGFKTTVDDIRGITFITHTDMELGGFYNLKDSISGERENISLYIADSDLIASANYQGKNWIFINGIVFLDGDGNRLALDYGERNTSDVNTGALNNVYVREQYGVTVKEKDIQLLENILKNNKVYVAFLGQKTTGKMELKSKYKDAMLLTIKKQIEIKKP